MQNNLTEIHLTKGRQALIEFKKTYRDSDKDCVFSEIKGTDFLNKNCHIDIVVFRSTGEIESYDIKDNMAYDNKGRECFVVEFGNVNGGNGSLFGWQQYFALKIKDFDDFYIIDRKALQAYLSYKINDKTEFVQNLQDAIYKKYQRTYEGKKDEITLIPIDDLLSKGIAKPLYRHYD